MKEKSVQIFIPHEDHSA